MTVATVGGLCCFWGLFSPWLGVTLASDPPIPVRSMVFSKLFFVCHMNPPWNC